MTLEIIKYFGKMKFLQLMKVSDINKLLLI